MLLDNEVKFYLVNSLSACLYFLPCHTHMFLDFVVITIFIINRNKCHDYKSKTHNLVNRELQK